MHGVSISSRDAEEAESTEKKHARAAKFNKYRTLCSVALKCHRTGDTSDQSLDLTTKLLHLNPDFYSLWNYRREILLDRKPGLVGDELDAVVATELKLTESALKEKNPKSYCTWWHRRWVVDTFVDEDGNSRVDLQKEIALCSRMLQLDERNFHCWGYRNHLVHLVGVDLHAELEFTTSLIEHNFSNYSAWNHRSRVLTRLGFVVDADQEPLLVVRDELELVHNAVFTEPADQSAWMYAKWLVEVIGDGEKSPLKLEQGDRVAVLEEERVTLEELLELEPDCKWAMVTIVEILRTLGVSKHSSKIDALCQKLLHIDPVHKHYYKFVQQTCSGSL